MNAENKRWLGEIQDYFIENLGIKKENYKEEQWETILNHFLKDSHIQNYFELLQALKWDEKLFQEITEKLIVSETWFFREKDSLFFIASRLREKKKPRPFRILSLPCSTGEEAYSIVIAFLEQGIASDDFKIDAVDISKASLLKAEKALYDMNAFRREGARWRDQWFERIDNKYYPPVFVRERVRFFHANIVDPRAYLPHSPYTVIFLRHLLIYMNEKAAATLLQRCWDMLEADGYLVVGAVESELVRKFGFSTTSTLGIPVFTKTKKPAVALK